MERGTGRIQDVFRLGLGEVLKKFKKWRRNFRTEMT